MKKILLSLATIAFAVASFAQGNGYLGISMKNVDNGVRIAEVLEHGAAKTFGLKMNDIIQEVDGIVMNYNSELKKYVVSKNWGDKIMISYLRNNVLETKTITLGNRADRIEYKITHRVSGKTETWSFDNKVIITQKNGESTEMKKINADKTIVLDLLTESYITQDFSDYDDKMEMINAIKKKHAAKRWIPSITYFIKTYTSESKVSKPVSKSNATLKVYPNPSNGMFSFDFKTINSNDKNLSWSVISVTGKVILTKESNDFTGKFSSKIDLTKLANGTYLLKIVNNKEVFTERLVVSK